MKVKRSSLVVLAMATVASTSLAQDVKTDYDRGADFTRYKTYSWEHVETRDPLWVSRIKKAVDSELAAKGWTLTESGGDNPADGGQCG